MPAREGRSLRIALRTAVAEESCCGKGSEWDTAPSPGKGADAVEEQQHGTSLLSEGQPNRDPPCAPAWVPCQLDILSFTQQREVRGFLSLSKDLSLLCR